MCRGFETEHLKKLRSLQCSHGCLSVHVINEIIINIIRLHRSTTYMWPIVVDGVVWRSVDLSWLWAQQKQLNRSRCRLGYGLWCARENILLDDGPDYHMRRVNFEGEGWPIAKYKEYYSNYFDHLLLYLSVCLEMPFMLHCPFIVIPLGMPHLVSGIIFLILSVNLIPVPLSLTSLLMLLPHLLTLSTYHSHHP